MVPEDAYSSLISQQQQLIPPPITQLSNLDMELKGILNNPGLSVDQKYDQYYRTFARYGNLQDQYKQPPPRQAPVLAPVQQQEVEVPKDIPELELLASLPQTARKKARLLLNHFKRKPQEIHWNNDGQLVVNGSAVPNSNITDLVHFFTRERPTAQPPSGAVEMAHLLQETNVPVEALARESLKVFKGPEMDYGLATLFGPEQAFVHPRAVETRTPPPPPKPLTPRQQLQLKRKTPASKKKSPLASVGQRTIKPPSRYGMVPWRDFDD